MQEPTFLVLTALVDGPQHGYGLLQLVEQISVQRVRLRVGTLYAVLDRLAAESLVEVVGEDVVNGRARRTYALTSDGLSALDREADRMATLVKVARARMSRRAATSRPARAVTP